MNVKLTEKEYQHMILHLIRLSINHYGTLERSSDENAAWIYFIESVKQRGIYSVLTPVEEDIHQKSKRVAKQILDGFLDDNDKYITTMT